MDYKRIINHIVSWINNYCDNNQIHTLVVGVSGGIDSAVVSKLCSLTGRNVILVEMPIGNYDVNGKGSLHIKSLCNEFNNISHEIINLTDSYNQMIKTLTEQTNQGRKDNFELVKANMASRLRMLTLYSFSNSYNGLVVGTGNKVEDFGIGFFTRGGDGTVDISPIGELVKSEVYSLGRTLGVNKDILEARPTDGLWDDGRTDEDQIGCTYDELEWAMNLQEKEGNDPDMDELSFRQKEVWNIYISRHFQNKHKMEPIPICNIPDYIQQMGDNEEVLR